MFSLSSFYSLFIYHLMTVPMDLELGEDIKDSWRSNPDMANLRLQRLQMIAFYSSLALNITLL